MALYPLPHVVSLVPLPKRVVHRFSKVAVPYFLIPFAYKAYNPILPTVLGMENGYKRLRRVGHDILRISI